MKKLLFLISILLALAPASLFASGIWGGGGGGGGGAGDFLANGSVPMTGNLQMGTKDITGIGSLGATGAGKATKGWFIDAEFTNIPSVNGVAGNATNGLVTNPMTTAGDLITGGASGVSTGRIAAGGTAGMYLRSAGAGAAPIWSTLTLPNTATAFKLAAYTATNVMTELAAVGNTGELLVGNTGAIPTWLAAGTNGYILKAAGAGVVPAWSNSLSIATFDMTSSTSSIPWIISATAPTTEGQGAWNSTTDILYIGDGAASVAQVGVGKTNVYDVDPIPIHWATNGTTAPTAAPTWLTSTNKARYQDFAGNADSDVTFEWTVPYGINATVAPTFQVEGWITAETVPATTETAKFVLACRSYSDNDPLSGAMSVTPVTVTYTFATAYARYDRWVSGYSGALSITDLAAGELVICNLKRDTTDTYAQPLGVSWIKMKFAKKLQGS